jgi:hypothetical protein
MHARQWAVVVAATTIALALAAPATAAAQSGRCGNGIPSAERSGYVPLPRGDVFCRLIADPKATESFVSFLREQSESAADTSVDIGSVGIADMFGIGRWGGSRPGDGIQLAITGSVFAQFDLGTSSYDLLNADYIIALPSTFRSGPISGRLRAYHQSSHLGDEFLLRTEHPDRQNISFEAVDMVLSVDAGPLRLYGGGDYLLRRDPTDLGRYVAHGGAELRPSVHIIPLGSLGGFRFVAAADLKASEERDWDPAVSARAGLEYDRAGVADPPARRWSLLFEFYDGPSPYGQFYREKVRHIGAGLHFSL